MKTMTIRELAAVKRVAQNSNANVIKKNKLEAKIAELTEEYNNLVEAIEADEAGIIKRFGHTSEELVEKVVSTTDKTDKDGNPIKVTKYIPREDILKFNEDKKVYEIIEPEVETEVNNDEFDEATVEEAIATL